MEQELRRLPDGTYAGAMTDEHICGIFGCCGDWNRREVRIGALTVYVYAIDGITSGGDASEYVVKPLMQDAFGGTMDELYDRALHRTVYNSVAVPCEDLQSTAEKLVNGFTVVLFGQRAIAFETKTSEKRSPSAPEVENTVKGPKDAFTETVRTNTGLLRRHLRTPALRLYETVVGRRSLTNVTLAWIDGLTDPALVQRPAQVEQLRYEELQTLSRIGMQVLHEDAVAPVQRAQIPLRICSTLEPDGLSAAAVHGADGPLRAGPARGTRRPARRRPAAGLSRAGRPRLSHDVGRGPGHGFRLGVVPARAALCRPAARPAAAGALCRDGGLSPADAADGAAAVDLREQARCAVPDHRGGARAAGRL